MIMDALLALRSPKMVTHDLPGIRLYTTIFTNSFNYIHLYPINSDRKSKVKWWNQTPQNASGIEIYWYYVLYQVNSQWMWKQSWDSRPCHVAQELTRVPRVPQYHIGATRSSRRERAWRMGKMPLWAERVLDENAQRPSISKQKLNACLFSLSYSLGFLTQKSVNFLFGWALNEVRIVLFIPFIIAFRPQYCILTFHFAVTVNAEGTAALRQSFYHLTFS